MKSGLVKLAAFFLLGLIIGSAAINALISGQIDRLNLANEALREELHTLHWELQEAKKNLDSRKKQVVGGIEVNVLLSNKEITEYEEINVQLVVEKKVKEWLEPLLGQDVSKLDYLLIPRVVDNREVAINGSNFCLQVNLVVVGQRIVIFVKAIPQKKSGRE